MVYANEVKKYFIDYVTDPKNIQDAIDSNRKFYEHWKDRFGPNTFDINNPEILVKISNEVNAPMFRSAVGYKTTLEDGKIKKLVAHYYQQGYC